MAGKGDNKCAGCGQFAGRGHRCPTVNPAVRSSVVPIVVASPPGALRAEVADRVERARQALADRQVPSVPVADGVVGAGQDVSAGWGSDGLPRQRLVGFHASPSPVFEPRDMPLHFGTRAAAEERAEWMRDSGEQWFVHEVEWEGPVVDELVPDDYANFVTGVKDRERDEIYDSLLMDRERFGGPLPKRYLGRLGRAFYVEGAAIPYKNLCEDESSTSYIVPNSLSVRVTRTERLT